MTKKVTISDVAQQVGVSKSAVSQYINGNYQKVSKQTRIKIQKAIEDLNYRPSKQAQFLTTKRSKLIGVVVADISNMYSSLLLKGISQYFESTNYQLIIVEAANSETKEREVLQKLIDQNVEGIIIQPSNYYKNQYEIVERYNIPMVFVDREIKDSPWTSVTTDNKQSVEIVMNEVIKKKYNNIIIVSEPIFHVKTREIRFQTIVDVAKVNKIDCTLIEIDKNHPLNISMFTQLFNRGKTVVFALNGTVLLKVLKLFKKNKIIIPKQTGLTGFDDLNITEITEPAITSIIQPSKLIGETVAEYLHLILQGHEPKNISIKNIIKSDIMWRDSL
ncbi:LacI family DNA-binding transcriptional regulator [Staphylococcus cohnii]|uniref:LacI family DNA-binding transcriptional regulator n=1 Tax=Staphylococcus cohnii TaxID=29382 RepID=UPI003D7EAF43